MDTSDFITARGGKETRDIRLDLRPNQGKNIRIEFIPEHRHIKNYINIQIRYLLKILKKTPNTSYKREGLRAGQ